MRVVIHIGATKTGSSALQATLFERRDILAAAGAHYSERGVVAGAHHLLAAAVHPGAWRMHADALPADRETYFCDAAAAILADAAAAGANTVILSSEYFWGSFPAPLYKRLAAAFAPCRFEVVAFVRRPDEWVASSYLQAVKSGESRAFGEWFDAVMGRWTSGLHYFRVINRWRHFLAADAVHVIRYADAKANVYAAFCDAVGLDVPADAPARVVNPSPSAASVQRLLSVNRSGASAEEKAHERRHIMSHQNGGAAPLDVMSTEERDAVLRLTQQSDRLLERTFLPGRWPPDPQADRQPPAPAPQAPAASA